ncbi:MAG TPA: aminotransferase class III-fold pyridoxal phosphate-dependent enzyme, partial [Acidimicrobiia bacterium]|nr:aminotransferase class III-fold pyridoxal phosphate-dependent enzyme [Acidimicrobiia bacterium]
IDSIVMACSGTEANEVALMMVRTATGRRGIVCTDAAYHGNSAEVAAMTRLPAGEQRDAVRSIPTPDLFRPPEPGLSADDLCRLSIRHLEEAIERLEADGHGFAAFVLCPILANEGLPQAPPGFFEQMMATVHAAGGLVVADEVQAGFGRTGEWWGYERSGFMPDVVTMGKPMGNGVPVSGAAASHDVVSAFRAGHRYFNTFAASPLQAAAGNAVLDEIERRGLVAQSRRVGEEMLAGLRALQAHDPRMGDVRGHGLFVGVDWVVPGTTDPDERGAAAMVEALKRRGMLMGRAGRHANLLKIRPPLVFDSDHAQSFLAGFADALGDAPH